MYEHHDAVLHAVREGVLIIGSDGRLLLANDEARRLLALPADAERRPVAALGLEPRLSALLASGREATDEVLLAGDRLLAANVRPTAPYGGPAGTVVTLRDSTELRALAGRAGRTSGGGRTRGAPSGCFSALDLPPDELLNHLDELVAHIDTDEAQAAASGSGEQGDDEGTWPGGRDSDTAGARANMRRTGITGATCLYAIYDPVGGRATLARAGHPGPAVIASDGTVSFPDLPVSPPLGLGGREPVETTELTLREGSRLVLYTDGLIEGRDRDIGAGLERGSRSGGRGAARRRRHPARPRGCRMHPRCPLAKLGEGAEDLILEAPWCGCPKRVIWPRGWPPAHSS